MQKPLTVGSLFAGIGGFDLGFERAGFEIKWQVEIDPFCRKVLEKHWPHVRRYEDVREVHGSGLQCSGCVGGRGCANYVEPVDVLVGGDPCQANSNAGNVWKSKHEDVGREFVRLVSELSPRFVVRENPSKIRADALWPADRFMDALMAAGYAAVPFRLRACCFGALHRRDRLFVLGALLDANGERLQGIEWDRLAAEYAGGTTRGMERISRQDGVPAACICRGADGVPNRVDRTRALGNAIVPQIAQWIAERIKEAEATA